MSNPLKTYVVEHLDEELGPWSELEYLTIAKESHEAGSKFCLSSLSSSLALPASLKSVPGFTAENRSVEVLFADDKSRVCLLDPSATKELAPEDGEKFNVFLFGGILGKPPASRLPPPSKTQRVKLIVLVETVTDIVELHSGILDPLRFDRGNVSEFL